MQEPLIVSHSAVTTSRAPSPGHYSQGRVVDFGPFSLLYTAGMGSADTSIKGEPLVGDSVLGQAGLALENVRAVLDTGAQGKPLHVIARNAFATTGRYDLLQWLHDPNFRNQLNKTLHDTLPLHPLYRRAEPTAIVTRLPLASENTLFMANAVALVGDVGPHSNLAYLASDTTLLSAGRSGSHMDVAEGPLIAVLKAAYEPPRHQRGARTIEGQMERVFSSFFENEEFEPSDVVSVTVALRDLEKDWDGYSEMYRRVFPGPMLPARTTIEMADMESRISASIVAIRDRQ